MTATRADVVVVGGGIVGLATAYRLLLLRPDLRLVVLEKESHVAAHQSGHNSGVLHAGLYYARGSLKARLCREGKAELERFCESHEIPFRLVGKLVVALDDSELPRFEALRTRADENGVPGLAVLGPEELREREPHLVGVRALWSPTTGIIDFAQVTRAYADEVQARGGGVRVGMRVTAIRERSRDVVVTTDTEVFLARAVVTCAGVQSDRVAAMAGLVDDARTVPFRGDYYTLSAEARSLVRSLIYPVPDPRFPFLGVHFTPRIDGEVVCGPNAVLAFARDGYQRTDIDFDDLFDVLGHPGFWRLAGKFWRMGVAELWRDWSKAAFVAQLQRYVPALRGEQMTFGPSGVRAQLLTRDGTLVDDFALGGAGRVLSVKNAPSPAATSSLAIGEQLAREALTRFD